MFPGFTVNATMFDRLIYHWRWHFTVMLENLHKAVSGKLHNNIARSMSMIFC
ncbi:Uncharacterised protein [Escherichia coli]|uniref:Uncharacterized protein n=1 Tax=Escherichia coli TaxID=562 RepID=A0A376Y309_ECOLX|nr:Uncharacterised protein [Escherichia coli]STJ78771.1 Uncharacterised protein [Escherichia coli]